MNNSKQYISYTLRGFVAFLFLISAIAKLYPSPYFAISTFEMKQLVPLGFSEGLAVYFSRILIGAEFALGLLLLQPHYLKRFVIPATIALLAVFAIHLTYTIFSAGNSGNCGCFGELLPMTPLESVFKNIVAIGLLIWLYKILPAGSDRNNFAILTSVLFASILFIFMLTPIARQTSNTLDLGGPIPEETALDTLTSEPTEAVIPTEATTPTPANPATQATPAAAATPATVATAPEAPAGPAQKKSVYSQFFAGADKGKKIIGLFAPGCEHCRETAKQLTEMKAKDKNFPDLYIIFMDEEADLIPDFFKFAGKEYPNKVLDVPSFWKVLSNSKDTPGVIYQWNGNEIKSWDGINEKKFVAAELLKALKR